MLPKKIYWNNSGKYQKEYDELKEHVPQWGESDNAAIEAVRRIGNVYYDLYNNGGCNEKFDELRQVYSWLANEGVPVGRIGYVNHEALYDTRDDDGAHFNRIAAALEELANIVIITAYNKK